MLHYEEHCENVTCEDILIKLFTSSQLAKILNQSVYSFYILESIAKCFSSRLPIYILAPSVCECSWDVDQHCSLSAFLPKITLYCLYIYFFISCEMKVIYEFLKIIIMMCTFVNCFFVVSVNFGWGMFTSSDSQILFIY